MSLSTFDPGGERDLVFIPVGINYDRVLEDRTLLSKLEAAPSRRGFAFALVGGARFVCNNLWLMLTGRWYRFGYACVNFGRPLSMREYVRHDRARPGISSATPPETGRKNFS